MLEVGTKVSWKSQSLGVWSEKEGVIVAKVPQFQKVTDIMNSLADCNKTKLKSRLKNNENSGVRDHDSYLVAVGDSKNKKPILYWPLVKGLQSV